MSEEPPSGLEEIGVPRELPGVIDAGLLYAAFVAAREALSVSQRAEDSARALNQACRDKKREEDEMEERHNRERNLFRRGWRRKLKTMADKSNAAKSLAHRANENSAMLLQVVHERERYHLYWYTKLV